MNPESAGILFVASHRTHGVHTRERTRNTSRLPSTRDVESTGVSGDDSVARQCAPVGDSLNDKQCGDHLFNPASHLVAGAEIAVVERTNLSISDGRQEEPHSTTSSSPQSNERQ